MYSQLEKIGDSKDDSEQMLNGWGKRGA